LFTRLATPCPINLISAFQASHHDALNEEALAESKDQNHWKNHDQSNSHHKILLGTVLTNERVEAKGKGKLAGAIEINERAKKVIPNPLEGEYSNYGKCWLT
jgi:hypothetical protein